MSVHSTYYEDEDDYKRDPVWEYRREQAGLYHDDEPEEKVTCGDCAHCRMALGFTREIVDLGGHPIEKSKPPYSKYGFTIKVNHKPTGRLYMCDLENELKQVDTWQEACEGFEW